MNLKSSLYIFLLLVAWAGTVDAQDYTVTNNNGDASAGSLGGGLQSASAVGAATDYSIGFDSGITSISLTAGYDAVTKNTGVTLDLSNPAPSAILTLNGSALGTTTPIFDFSGGGTFILTNMDLTGGTLGVRLGSGSILSLSNVTIENGVALNSEGTVSAASGSTSTISGIVSGTSGLTVTGGGRLNLAATETFTGAVVINAGTLALIDDGDISAASGVNLAVSGANFDISDLGGVIIKDLTGVAGTTISLGNAILSVGTENSTTFAGVLQDDDMGDLLKQGSGTLTLTGANTYRCSTYINEGTLAIGAGGSIAASCSLDLVEGATFDISAGGNQSIQDLYSSSGGTINLGANTLTLGTDNSSSFNGVIQGTGGITKQGMGTLALDGINTYTGATAINDGTLEVDTNGSIATSSSVDLTAATSSFDIASGGNQSIQNLSGVSGSTVNLGSNVLTVSVTSPSTTFAGSIQGEGGSLVKSGGGTLVLSGTSNYTNGTSVNGGRLQVDGSINGTVIVASGAEVGGHGHIHGTIGGSGSVGPGNSPGILTADSTDPSDGLIYNFEFTQAGSPVWSNATASSNDVLHLTDGTPFTSALSSSNTINFYLAGLNTVYQGGFFTDGSFDNLSENISDATLQFYLLDNSGGTVSYNGNLYDVLSAPHQLTVVSVSDADFTDGTTDGFTLQVSVVPEPSTWALMALGLGGLWYFQRRRSTR